MLKCFRPVVGGGTETGGVTNFFAISHPGRNTKTVDLSTSPDNVTCPVGQTIALAAITYAQITVTDTTNGVTIVFPGTFSSTFM